MIDPAKAQLTPTWLVYARPADDAHGQPRIAVVVAGLGLGRAATTAAIKLPGAITLAFASHARGLQNPVRLMERVAEVTGAAAGAVETVREAHREQLRKAAEAYKNAGIELGRVTGRTARQRLEALKMSTRLLEAGNVAEEPKSAG